MKETKPEGRVESEIIRNKRIELGISQHTLAMAVGLQLRQYQRFEYGERLVSRASMRQGLRICAALELDPFMLVFIDEPILCAPLEREVAYS